jgi:hypothetical protein
MVGLDIAARRLAEMTRRGEEASMLARAIAVQRRRFLAGMDERMGRRLVVRKMAAALQIVGTEIDAIEPSADRFDVALLAVMRGAGEGKLGGAEPIMLGGATLDEGQGLKRLDRRAREDRPLDVAPAGDDGAGGVDDRGGAAMAALDEIAAQDLDEDGIGWVDLARHRARLVVTAERPPCRARRGDASGLARGRLHRARRAWHAGRG